LPALYRDSETFGDRLVIYPTESSQTRTADRISTGVIQTWTLPPDAKVFKPDLLPINFTPDRLREIVERAQIAGYTAVDFANAGTVVIHDRFATRSDTLDQEALELKTKQMREVMEVASSRYPASWIFHSNMGKAMAIGQSKWVSGRGYYQQTYDPDKPDQLMLGNDLTEERVAVHELAHRMERVVPWIRPSEWVFHWRRTSKVERMHLAGEGEEYDAVDREVNEWVEKVYAAESALTFVFRSDNPRKYDELVAHLDKMREGLSGAKERLRGLGRDILVLGAREEAQRLLDLEPGSDYRENERARPDEYLTPYIGKDYGDSPTSSYEVMSMGMEGVWTGSRPMHRDNEHRHLIVGLLAAG
jgi:hypothetical protein